MRRTGAVCFLKLPAPCVQPWQEGNQRPSPLCAHTHTHTHTHTPSHHVQGTNRSWSWGEGLGKEEGDPSRAARAAVRVEGLLQGPAPEAHCRHREEELGSPRDCGCRVPPDPPESIYFQRNWGVNFYFLTVATSLP